MSKYLLPFLGVVLMLAFAGNARAQGMSFRYGGGYQSPEENIYKSQLYDRRLSLDAGFRAYRKRKECYPINHRALRADCLGSFDTYEPIAPGYGWRRWWGR